MHLTTVIFDMDGLLIDSEPLWREGAQETFASYGIQLSEEQYKVTTGLRSREFVSWWLSRYKISETEYEDAEKMLVKTVIDKVIDRGNIMQGVPYIFDFFRQQNFKIGLASSSSMALIDVVVDKLGARNYLHAITSAENLVYGKPHPQVYLNCAETLNSKPVECICFEDSFNGMIAGLAARMKCVIVPEHEQYKQERWGAASLKLSSLQNFNQLHLDLLER
ncbi:MAG TPA: hexitol phosphatase HxpB [Arachidicoccus sp.]